jgi:peptidoglycan/LPS O-acetylase OafA/YrhL
MKTNAESSPHSAALKASQASTPGPQLDVTPSVTSTSVTDHGGAVPTGSSGAEHLVVLDGLRGVAALVIGALHAKQVLVTFDRYAHPYLAVDFFFCLSGFVIALAYERRLQTNMSFGEFTGRRILRLYPVIFLGSLLGGAVYFLGAMREGGSLSQAAIFTVTSLALLPGGFLFGKDAYPVNAPIWSLFFEVIANLFYAALIPITTRTLLVSAVISGAVLASLSYRYGGVAQLGFGSPALFLGGFARVAFPFIAGLVVYRFVGRLKWKVSPLLAIVGLLLILATPLPLTWWFDVIAICAIIPLILLAAARASAGYMTKPLVILGAISYPFYLIHQPILRVLKHFGPFSRLTAHHPIIAIGLAITVIAIASYPVFLLYDQRLRELFGRMFFPKSKTVVAAS